MRAVAAAELRAVEINKQKDGCMENMRAVWHFGAGLLK